MSVNPWSGSGTSFVGNKLFYGYGKQCRSGADDEYEGCFQSVRIKGFRANADVWTSVVYFYGINRIGSSI